MATMFSSDLEMLKDALVALTERNPPKLHIVQDHLERVITNMSKYVGYLEKKGGD